jgi:ADP-heptose:LPS heptosyltransferase
MIDENLSRSDAVAEGGSSSPDRLDGRRVTVVYTMHNHLGDFVAIGGLLKKFDLLGVEFESLVAHRDSPHVSLFDGKATDRFFNVARTEGFLALLLHLRRRRQEGRLVFGIPMAPGSLQAFFFFWLLKKLGALTYIVDFNLNNADILTPPRRRYIFDRHLAQAAELFRHPEWLEETALPLALASRLAGPVSKPGPRRRIGFFPWSGRSRLPEFQWPVARWQELARLILQDPAHEITLLGRDDAFARLEQAVRSSLPAEMEPRFIARPASSVPDLVAGLRELDALVTLNTSALHLAHALKLPVVALCGSSAEFWLPEGDHVRLVRDTNGVLPPSDQYCHDPLQPSLQRIAVPAVYAAFQELARRGPSPS